MSAGSWLLAYGVGLCIQAYWCWPTGYGLWVMAYGLWPIGYGLWVMAYGLWPMGYGLWMLAYANGSRGHMEVFQNPPSASRLIQQSRATLSL